MSDLPTIEFLHTADVHIETFERLLTDRRGEIRIRHEVRADWLDEARSHGLSDALRGTVTSHLREAAARSAVVVCTCSTLGPIADETSAAAPSVFRIDRPMMEEAVRLGGTCVIAVCLESTIAPTTNLFEDVCATSGAHVPHVVASAFDAWPHFESGRMDRFADAITSAVRDCVAQTEGVCSIVLAQASMACAEERLANLGPPVLSSPRLAANEALRRALS